MGIVKALALAGLSATALAMAGCVEEGGYGPPRTAGSSPVDSPPPAPTPPVARAPVPARVPAPAPAPTPYAAQRPAPVPPPPWQASEENYYWIDAADGTLDAIGDAPPDIVFPFNGAEAWGWLLRTGHAVYAENAPDGSIRTYFFEPYASEPFLVQEAQLSFGYRGGRMAVAYDAGGAVLSPRESELNRGLAMDLLRRGRAIRLAAQDDRQWDAIDAGWWAWQLRSFIDLRLRWDGGRTRHPGWRAWRARPDAQRWRGALAGERDARAISGERFRRWREGGYRGPPPRV
ncbi:hypothetical protein, partial [Sphingomonas sp.]|uniref:hypothetical protein n=1 Tax=Sphingomonas sp. TaxID=28214 RepID=UPI001EC46A9B